MTDAELERLANLAIVIDHLTEHGMSGSLAWAKLSRERDAAVIRLALPEPTAAPAPKPAAIPAPEPTPKRKGR